MILAICDGIILFLFANNSKRRESESCKAWKNCSSLINCPKFERSIQPEERNKFRNKKQVIGNSLLPTMHLPLSLYNAQHFSFYPCHIKLLMFVVEYDEQFPWKNKRKNSLQLATQFQHTGSAGPQKSRKTA